MLYIMRYGKTDWNVQHKLQGRIDIPNNEKYMKKNLSIGKKKNNVDEILEDLLK